MNAMDEKAGTLALVGGSEWTSGCTFDQELVEMAGTREVLVLPTAAAYQQPERRVLRAGEWFDAMGAVAHGLMVLSRADAQDADAAKLVAEARFIYLSGGSPLHLRSVLKDSAVFAALHQAFLGGAVVAGSAAGAMVLTDPMVDPRGGALTVGLGLVERMAVVAHFGDEGEDVHGEKIHRSVALAPGGTPVVAIPPRTALIREPATGWRSAGQGAVSVFVDGRIAEAGTAILPR